MKKKNGFTLIELLAVIVILAIILVIAVPKILSVINDATKNSFESSLKMIASSAEKDYQIISDKSMAEHLELNSIIYENDNYDLGKILNELAFKYKDKAILPNELKALYIQPPPVFGK